MSRPVLPRIEIEALKTVSNTLVVSKAAGTDPSFYELTR